MPKTALFLQACFMADIAFRKDCRIHTPNRADRIYDISYINDITELFKNILQKIQRRFLPCTFIKPRILHHYHDCKVKRVHLFMLVEENQAKFLIFLRIA